MPETEGNDTVKASVVSSISTFPTSTSLYGRQCARWIRESRAGGIRTRMAQDYNLTHFHIKFELSDIFVLAAVRKYSCHVNLMFKFETRLDSEITTCLLLNHFVEAPSLHKSLAGRIRLVRIPQTLNVEQNVWIHGDSDSRRVLNQDNIDLFPQVKNAFPKADNTTRPPADTTKKGNDNAAGL
ncbi:hypothetical protein BDZ97DRAFT_1763590 [Flammula alnicola]|nr:hypothetical protein BDZ97DRAFT_1763590 [Flammula alnicola]